MHTGPDYLDICFVNAMPDLLFNKDDKRQNLGETVRHAKGEEGEQTAQYLRNRKSRWCFLHQHSTSSNLEDRVKNHNKSETD